MTPRSPGAFMLSATFHAAIIAVVLMLAVMAGQSDKPKPHVLELVAGEGDNYGATAAPRLGTPGGVKLEVPVPAAPKPRPTPPAPAPVETPPAPVPIPVPSPKAPPKPTEQSVPNFRKQIVRKLWAAEAKAKREIAKQRAEEERRRRLEDLERKAREKAGARSGTAPKYSRIDAEGIAKGVSGGSTDNKEGGAGGKALAREDGPVIDAYFSLLKQRVLNAIDKPAGVSDELTVTVSVHIWPDGRLTGARVIKSSGSDEFDRAVITAFGRVQMPEHPEHKSEDLEMVFRTKDTESG